MVVLSFLNSGKIVLYSIWVYNLYFFVKIFYHIYLLCCGEQACATECTLRSRDYFYDLAFLFLYIVLGTELRSSALAATFYAHWEPPHCPFGLYYKVSISCDGQQDKKKQPELCAGLRNGRHLEANGAERSNVSGLQMRCLSLRLRSSFTYQQWQDWGKSPAVNAKVEWRLPQSPSEDAMTLGGQMS